jgi:predicted permease
VLNGYPLTIVGVGRAGFDGVEPGYSPQIRIPMMMKHELTGPFYTLNDRRGRFAQVFGRLKPGVTLEQAKAGLQPLFHQILSMEVREKDFAKATEHTRQQFLKMWMDVLPAAKGRSSLRQQFSNPLLALMGIVALVLLIACSNVANLLIARATARQKEIAVRLALGAGRGRLIVQLLEESLLLSSMGGILGIGLAIVIDRALIGFLPQGTSQLTLTATPDWRVLGFTVLISVLTGLLFGLAPAIQSTRPQLAGTLKDQAGAVVGGASVGLRKGLVVAQVSLSLLLLIAAGLFIQSLKNLQGIHPGFETRNLLSFAVNPTLNGYKNERSLQFYRQLTERLNRTPGISSVTLAIMPLLDGNEWDSTVSVEGYAAKEGEWVDPHMQFVSPGYFQTLAIPVLLGRDFSDRDDKGTPPVALVNERFAKRYFAGRSPVGLHVGMGGNPGTKTDIEIVGVVKDARYESLRDEVPYQLYRPYRQMDFVLGMTVYARAQGDPADLFASMRRTVDARTTTGQIADERAIAGVAVLGLRTASHAAGGHRSLRRDGLHGGAAHARDRHTHGAGGKSRVGGLAGDARSAGAFGDRRRDRERCCVRGNAAGTEGTLRYFADRRAHDGALGSGHRGSGDCVGLSSGAPRHCDRPDAGAALGVAPRCYSRAQIDCTTEAIRAHGDRRTAMVDRRPDLPCHADQLRQPADNLGAGAGDHGATETQQPGVRQHHEFLSAGVHG